MTEDPRFLRETVVNVDAAVVGIGSGRWVYIATQEASDETARTIMQKHHFDILPIVDGANVKQFFRTLRWNDYSVIQRTPVSHRDLLPLTTPIRDVIRGLAQERRAFYFLTAERMIAGLLSVANLNCRQVGVWLLSLLTELEVELAAYVTRHVGEQTLLGEEFVSTRSARASDIRKRYEQDRARGVDAPLAEYLYLSDFVNIVARRKFFRLLGYESRDQFLKVFAPIIDLRNAAAHPVRSLVTNEEACADLWSTLQKVDEVLFALRTA
ncbi:MAG: hypothetical protein ACRD3J_29340 [Thermoanaerobaculia bacterium]